MNKIYYFFSREYEKCYFFTDKECAEFYKELIVEYNYVNELIVKTNDFEGTDVFTLKSFKEELTKKLHWTIDEEEDFIKDFISILETKIREEKLNKLLNE